MTKKEIWDFILLVNESKKSLPLEIYKTNDNYFHCAFYHRDNLIQFKITKEYNLVDLWSYGVDECKYEIDCWSKNLPIPYNSLKRLIKPVIRDCKLKSIGI